MKKYAVGACSVCEEHQFWSDSRKEVVCCQGHAAPPIEESAQYLTEDEMNLMLVNQDMFAILAIVAEQATPAWEDDVRAFLLRRMQRFVQIGTDFGFRTLWLMLDLYEHKREQEGLAPMTDSERLKFIKNVSPQIPEKITYLALPCTSESDEGLN